jgi:hypothetical protein
MLTRDHLAAIPVKLGHDGARRSTTERAENLVDGGRRSAAMMISTNFDRSEPGAGRAGRSSGETRDATKAIPG